ncbi:MAG: MerR family transcriptional regulator [Reichenbachiella sp.]
MSIYSVAQVESLSGIKAHTLRIWEKRYSFLNPERTSTNIRYYSDDQMRQLLNIGILIRNGFKISKIDKMSNDDINDSVIDIVSRPVNGEYQDQIQAMSIAMLEMDEDSFNIIFQKQVNRVGVLSTILNVVYPFLAHVGVLWGASKAMPAQEHFISNLIRQKLITAIDSIAYSREVNRSIALFLPQEEEHEIGLLLATYIAKDLGWKIYYLGARVPYDNLGQIAEISKCDLFFTVAILSQISDLKALVDKFKKQTNLPLLMAGNHITQEYDSQDSQIIPIADPNELIKFLKSYQ